MQTSGFQEIQGFLLDFRYRAESSFRKLHSDLNRTVKLSADAGKWYKSGHRDINRFFGSVDSWLTRVNIRIEKHMSALGISANRIGRIFGEQGAAIVSRLMSVEAAIAAVSAAAIKAAVDVDTTRGMLVKELGASAGYIKELSDVQAYVSIQTGKSLSLVGQSLTQLASRGLFKTAEDARLLLLDSVMLSEVSGANIQQVNEGYFVLRKTLGLTADELHDLSAAVMGMAQQSGRSASEAVVQLGEVGMVAQRAARQYQRAALTSIMAFGQMAGDALGPELLDSAVAGLMDVRRLPELMKLGALVGHQYVSGITQAFRSGDVGQGLREVVKASAALRPDADKFKKFASTFQEVFGVDIRLMERLGDAGVEAFDKILDAGNAAAKDKDFLTNLFGESRTTWEKLFQLLNRFAAALRPVGELLLGVFDVILSVLNPVVELIAEIVNQPVVKAIIQWVVGIMALNRSILIVIGTLKILHGSIFAIGAYVARTLMVSLLALPTLLVSVAAAIGTAAVAMWGMVTATVAWTVALLSNPIVLTIVAIAGAVALIVTYWDEMVDGIKTAFTWLSDMASLVADYLVKPFQEIGYWLSSIFGGGSKSISIEGGAAVKEAIEAPYSSSQLRQIERKGGLEEGELGRPAGAANPIDARWLDMQEQVRHDRKNTTPAKSSYSSGDALLIERYYADRDYAQKVKENTANEGYRKTPAFDKTTRGSSKD